MELIMQELLNAGIITMEQVERARMEKIMKALEEYGIESPKITKRKDENRYICNIPKNTLRMVNVTMSQALRLKNARKNGETKFTNSLPLNRIEMQHFRILQMNG